MTLFISLTETCQKIASTSSRLEKMRILNDFLRKLSREEIKPAINLILGRIAGKGEIKTGISSGIILSALKKVLGDNFKFRDKCKESADLGEYVECLLKSFKPVKQQVFLETTYSLKGIYEVLRKAFLLKGKKSKEKKEEIVASLLTNLTPSESKYLVNIILGDLRIGLEEGTVEQALAKLLNLNIETVKRANMLLGDISETVYLGLTDKKSLLTAKIHLFKPIKPMLAETAENLKEIFDEIHGPVSLEPKLDGARVQIHHSKGKTKIFTRRLSEVTNSLPEIITLTKQEFTSADYIVEGEVVAVSRKGEILPFNYLMRRFRRTKEITEISEKIKLKLFLFDILYYQGKQLIDAPYEQRREKLVGEFGRENVVPALLTKNDKKAEEFFLNCVKEGHEGVMAKNPKSIYEPGKRGKNWLKLKKTLTLDLVIVGAQWGYGRRRKWLSDYFLAVWNESKTDLLIVGKTFKGLTDQEFEWITKKLLEKKLREKGYVVWVKPEIVVETAFNEIQKSKLYPSGYVLRFARIKNIRFDKELKEADTIKEVKKIFETQKKRNLEKIWRSFSA